MCNFLSEVWQQHTCMYHHYSFLFSGTLLLYCQQLISLLSCSMWSLLIVLSNSNGSPTFPVLCADIVSNSQWLAAMPMDISILPCSMSYLRVDGKVASNPVIHESLICVLSFTKRLVTMEISILPCTVCHLLSNV